MAKRPADGATDGGRNHKKIKEEHNYIPGYVPFTISTRLPPLPPITNPAYQTAPFKHKSTVPSSHLTPAEPEVTYERLEFLGDAYIEVIASRLLFARFGYLSVGRQSQLRELVVKNETLAEYSRLYGLDKRVSVEGMEWMIGGGKLKGNKGFNKVLGDVFEAYVAAVVLSDPEHGFAVAEKWLTSLWALKLEDAVSCGDVLGRSRQRISDLCIVQHTC